MNNLIIAGIINRNTGEITDTTCSRKDTTAVYLKVRDELQCKHGQGEFMAFEFGCMNHMGYYNKKMINKDKNAFRGLRILFAKYEAYQSKKHLDSMKNDLAAVEEISEDCAKLYSSKQDEKKRQLINEITGSEIDEAQKEVKSAESDLNAILRRLTTLEKEQADHKLPQAALG